MQDAEKVLGIKVQMLDEKRYSGEWWIPSNPDVKVRGNLTFNQTIGALLELQDEFSIPFSTVYGTNSAGTPMTLTDCVLLGGFPGEFCRISGKFFFFGAHFESYQKVRFKEVHCQISHLNDWISKSTVEIKGDLSKKTVIKYNRPETMSITISPECRLDIDIRLLISENRVNNETKLKNIGQISFHLQQENNLEEFLNLIWHFRDFLCLVTQETVFPMNMVASVENQHLHFTDILYKLNTPVNTTDSLINPVLSFSDIEDRFFIFMKNWYQKRQLLEPILTLYSGTNYGRFVYLDFKFLSLVQALEAYHRRFISNEESPKKLHRKRVKDILLSVPDEYKEWLINKLIYSNEPYLRKRLNDICEKFIRHPIYLPIGDKQFIDKVVNTRNYMTHYDVRLKEKAANGNELFNITEKLKILVELCLFKEIGLSIEEITKFMRQKYVQRLNRLPIQNKVTGQWF